MRTGFLQTNLSPLMFRFRIFSLILILTAGLPCLSTFGQVNDAGLWMSINLEKKFSQKWSLHFSEELRMYENITEAGSFFSEISGEYNLNKNIAFSVGYRFTNKRNVDDSYSKRHRVLFNVNLKEKFGKIRTNFRLRYQTQYADVQSSETGVVPDSYLRPKLTLKYDLDSKFVPFIFGEMFFQTNRPDGMLFDNYRVSAGCEYEFSKKSTLELGYLVNREVQVANPWTLYVISIGWNYIFK